MGYTTKTIEVFVCDNCQGEIQKYDVRACVSCGNNLCYQCMNVMHVHVDLCRPVSSNSFTTKRISELTNAPLCTACGELVIQTLESLGLHKEPK
jgi:hypothetical protein